MRQSRHFCLPFTRNFNPRTPYGMRQSEAITHKTPLKFQSTHPLRDATATRFWLIRSSEFQSTHPLRDATLHESSIRFRACNFNPRTPYGMRLMETFSIKGGTLISIHAPLTGCDKINFDWVLEATISIHAPLTGCDLRLSL